MRGRRHPVRSRHRNHRGSRRRRRAHARIFLDVGSPALKTFLAEQRQHRIIRLREMVDRLGELGIVLDADVDPAACYRRPR